VLLEKKGLVGIVLSASPAASPNLVMVHVLCFSSFPGMIKLLSDLGETLSTWFSLGLSHTTFRHQGWKNKFSSPTSRKNCLQEVCSRRG